ncbi:MAG: helix-turn-helix transcriptional regulator [Fastidiosipila sp.]|nr:helix-turn-helix transcriptional regulator [Fastidiosipila sp.]
MTSSEKLNTLFVLTEMTNAKLAKELHVDASLVSRWRKGTRNVTSNIDTLISLSQYFSKLIVHRQQFDILNHLMSIDADITASKNNLSDAIMAWFSEQVLTADEFIIHTPNPLDDDFLNAKKHYDENNPSSMGYQFLLGMDGRLNAVAALMNHWLDSDGVASDLIFYVDEHRDVTRSNIHYAANFLSRHPELTRQLNQISLIIPSDMEPADVIAVINLFVPFFDCCLFQMYEIKRAKPNTCQHYLAALVGVGSIVSSTYFHGEPLSVFIPDLGFTRHLYQNLVQFGNGGISLIEQIDRVSFDVAVSRRLDVIQLPGDLYYMGNPILLSILPVGVLEDIIGRFSVDHQELAEIKSKSEALLDRGVTSVEKYNVLVCAPLYSPEEIKEGILDKISFPSKAVDETERIIDEKNYILILEHLIKLMEQKPNFNFQVIDMLSHNYGVWVKPSNAVHVSGNYPKSVIYTSNQPILIKSHYHGIIFRYMKIPKEKRKREYNMQLIKDHIELFKRHLGNG